MGNESLTTERIRKKFKNNFDLCNFSIGVARNLILGGELGGLTEVLGEIEKRADGEAPALEGPTRE